MDEKVIAIIRNIKSLADLAQFEKNAERRKAITEEIRDAIRARSGELGRALVAERTGLDLGQLTSAEEKIILAVSEYAGIKKRLGVNTSRTFQQLRNRGLKGAAEASVTKSKPTQGFTTLAQADLAELSFEKIVVDHPDEFSARALWFARRTLDLPNEDEKPPSLGDDDARPKAKNPNWTREELILALNLYLQNRDSLPSKDDPTVIELSEFLRNIANKQGVDDTYRNPNGVYMKLNNFKRLDPRYTTEGKIGLERGGKLEELIWNEFVNDPAALIESVKSIRN